MLKKAKIEQLSKINLRYRILQMDGESYLLDADRPFLISYFFPWILSFIPHRAYPLTKEEVQSLAPSDLSKVLNKKDTQKKGLASAFGMGTTAVLLSKAFPIEKYLYFSSHVLNFGMLALVFSLVIGIRIWTSIRKPMPNIVNSNHPIKVYLVTNDRKHRLLSMMAPTIFAGLVVFSSCAIFSNIAPNFILHVALLIFLSLFMFFGNILFFSPVVDYKVKIKPSRKDLFKS